MKIVKINSIACTSCIIMNKVFDKIKEEYDIDSEFGENGIYVEEKDYDIADSVLVDMEMENEINQEDLEEEDEE